MPTYEYECKTCSHRFEAFQSISDDPIKNCPECGKEVRRLIGGGLGVIFKGSGFYVTDNRKGSAPAGSSDGSNKTEGESAAKKEKGKSSDSSDSASSGDSGKAAKEPSKKD